MAKKVNIKELARRYTTAVFELARSEGALDNVSKDLESLESAIAEDKKLQKFLNSPLLSAAEQLDLIREISKKFAFNAITANFLLMIARNRRLSYLTDISAALRERIAEEKGEIKAQVISADKLTTAQITAIEKELSAKTGKKVQAVEQVDAGIIGGLVIKIGSKMYDYSIRSRLDKLRQQMKAAS